MLLFLLATLPEIKTIWECDKIERGAGTKGPYWKCLHCKTEAFSGTNASKALAHVLKERGHHVRPCNGFIPPAYARRYEELMSKAKATKETKQSSTSARSAKLDSHQERVAVKIKRRRSLSPPPPSSQLIPKLPTHLVNPPSSVTGSVSAGSFLSPNNPNKKPRQRQTFVHMNAPDPASVAKLDVAIADFIHGNSLSFRLVRDPKFVAMIKAARFVPVSYRTPDRRKIGGELLLKNYEQYIESTKTKLLRDAASFGLSCYGDGATLMKCPLTNVLFSGKYQFF